MDQDLSHRTGSRRFTYEVTNQLRNLGHEVKILTTRLDRDKCFKQYLSMPVEVMSGRNVSSNDTLKLAFEKARRRNHILEVLNNLNFNLIQAQLAMKISERIAETESEIVLFHYHGEHWLMPFFYSVDKAKGAVYLNMVPPKPRPMALPFQELTVSRKIIDKFLDFPPLGRWKRRSLSNTSLFITPSRFQLEQAQRQGTIGSKKAAIVPLGVNHSEFYPTGEEEPFALCLGRIHPHKFLELAIMSMKNTNPDHSLVIAGDIDQRHMWYLDRLIDLAAETKISDRFEVILSPSDTEVVQLMQKCSVFLFPSTIDTFGLVVLEAMASGKPIVACNRGGVPEIVSSAGFLIEPEPTGWQEVVTKLLSDSRLRQRMGQKALRRSKAYSWGNTATRLLDAFKGICD